MLKLIKNDSLKLLMATVTSQGILVLSSPILSRIYPVDGFSRFGTVFAIGSLISGLATLKYESIILSEDTDDKALQVMFLSIFSAFLLILASLFFLEAYFLFFTDVMSAPSKDIFLLGVGLGLLIAVNSTIQIYINRKKLYNTMCTSYLLVAIFTTTTSILLSKNINGLVLGLIFAYLVNISYYSYVIRESFVFVRHPRFYLILAIENIEVPKFAIPASLLNGIINQLPILFMNFSYNPTAVGYYNMIQRTMAAPSSVFSKSLTVKYKQELSEELLRDGSGEKSFLKYARFFLVLSMIIFIPVMLYGDKIFVIAFGEKWLPAGQIARVYAFAVAVTFIVSPLANILYISRRNDIDLMWHFFSSILMLVSFVFCRLMKLEFNAYILVLVVNYVFSYTVYFFICLNLSKTQHKHI